MRAAWYDRTGPASEVLALGEMPDPAPGPGEVLVALRASGINPADVKRRGGWRGAGMEHDRVIPHADGAGVIVETGKGVDPERVGRRVWLWNAQGGYGEAGRAFGTAAQRVAIAAAQAVPLPDGLSFFDGACLGVPAMTAYMAVFADGDVADRTLLVQGAGGAVAHFAVQFAQRAGARVIGTAGSPERRGHALAAGAETVLDRHAPDLAERILAVTGGAGVDCIIEVDFGANLPVTTAVLKPGGTVASFSSSSKPAPTLPYYAFAAKGATVRFVQGFRLPGALRAAGQAHIAALAEAGALDVAVGRVLPLERIAEAHEAVERGAVLGNTVLQIA